MEAWCSKIQMAVTEARFIMNEAMVVNAVRYSDTCGKQRYWSHHMPCQVGWKGNQKCVFGHV